MSLRRRSLPRGWYPEDPQAVRDLLSGWVRDLPERPVAGALAALAPHAGWSYSGRLAARAAASLATRKPDTLVIIGGHLPPGEAGLAAGETGYESPLGPLDADLELLGALETSLGRRGGWKLGRDSEVDNTVEVLLPIAAFLFPGAKLLWLRAPNDESSIDMGEALFAASTSLGRRLACLGSSDLTHYGPNYGFSPKGRGREAEAWVREINDRRFIEALLALDARRALALAQSERSACSSGAAASALAFALSSGASRATLLDYCTSLDTRQDESFVGYAAIAFHKEEP